METAPELEAAVLKEAGGLDRFFNRIMSCRVVIEGPRRQEYGGLYNVRIDLGVPGEELVVEHNPTLHTGLQATEAMRKTKNPNHTESAVTPAARSTRHSGKCAAGYRTTRGGCGEIQNTMKDCRWEQ